MNTISSENTIENSDTKKNKSVITPQMKAVLDYLAEYNEISDSELQELLNIKKNRLLRDSYVNIMEKSKNSRQSNRDLQQLQFLFHRKTKLP